MRKCRQEAQLAPNTRFVAVADSEADIYELLVEAQAEPRQFDWIVRGCQDRALDAGDENETEQGRLNDTRATCVRELVSTTQVLFTHSIKVRGRESKVSCEDRGRRHPNFVELPDATILCSFFTWPGRGDLTKEPDLAARTGIIRSLDGAQTWEQEPRRLPGPFIWDATDGPPIVLKDGSVLIAVYGSHADAAPSQIGVFRSTDSGRTWQLLSVVKSDHDLGEPSVAQLPDGRLVMIARAEGDIVWSDDGGRTWTNPVTFGMRM